MPTLKEMEGISTEGLHDLVVEAIKNQCFALIKSTIDKDVGRATIIIAKLFTAHLSSACFTLFYKEGYDKVVSEIDRLLAVLRKDLIEKFEMFRASMEGGERNEARDR